MKGDLIVAAAALLGSASAGVHKMKLKKIPLSDQLVMLERYRKIITEWCC